MANKTWDHPSTGNPIADVAISVLFLSLAALGGHANGKYRSNINEAERRKKADDVEEERHKATTK